MGDAHLVVLYDGNCAFCRSQVRQMQRWDWRKRLQFVANDDPRVALLAPAISSEALLARIHCVNPDGRVTGGARCLRQVGIQMPLLAPAAFLLWLPGALWVAEQVYGWISRHRHTVGRICGCR